MKIKINKIYLAGGFKSGWQDVIIQLLTSYKIFDPRMHNLDDPPEYTKWDLNAIKESDLIIAYMEKGNPGGYALSLEIGYAKALGKRILLIDEHDNRQRQRYFEMVREVSDQCYESFDYFIENIESIINDL